MSARSGIAAGIILAITLIFSPLCSTAAAKRRLSVGDETPEFVVKDLAGRSFEYKSDSEKVLMVAFLESKRERTARAAEDIEKVLGELGPASDNLDVVVVVGDANETYFKSVKSGPAEKFHIVLENGFELWGKFGIIVTPTVVLSGKDGKIAWVKAGHSHTFAPLLKAQLNAVLGIVQEVDPNEAGLVKAVANTTVDARVKRHLRMADMLKRKGRIDSATEQIRLALELDPNSIEVALALTDLHLRAGHGAKALAVIARLAAKKLSEKTRALLASGRAKLQAGELDEAEKVLLEAESLDPNSSQVLFELGKVYQAKEKSGEAIEAYRRALSIIFGDKCNPAAPSNSQD
ncbi:MAG: tetratricopeptide repeat protein [Planctomycetota bacterium]